MNACLKMSSASRPSEDVVATLDCAGSSRRPPASSLTACASLGSDSDVDEFVEYIASSFDSFPFVKLNEDRRFVSVPEVLLAANHSTIDAARSRVACIFGSVSCSSK